MEPGEEQVQNSTRGLTPQPVLITNNPRELFREKMTHPQNELILSQMSKPWAIVKRIVGLVIITYLLSQSILMIFFGLYLGEFEGIFMSYIGLFCSLPLLFIFFWIRRPRLIHIKLAIPNEEGKKTHILPNNETLVTPIPTKFSHHLVHDSGLLDMPPSKKLWMIFASTMLISLLIFIALLDNPSDFIVIITIIFVIPTWLAGFSIPVFAWWSYSARTLNMPTTGYRAESALVAGMICTIPALLINTSGDIFFSGIFGLDSPISQLLLLSLIAPIGEEICKLAAIWWCKEFIDSPRRGFEIGITVGLGFAMLENLQYIALSWTGGPLSFTITSLIRAIGSIPGHALWTGLTGIGFAWYILNNGAERDNMNHKNEKILENKWQLIDSKTNEIIETTNNIEESIELNVTENIIFFKKEEEISEQKSNNLPETLSLGLTLAIVGHSFWNGSSFLIDYLLNNVTENIIISTIGSLLWIFILISGLLLIGKLIVKNVKLLPDKMV
ncbi:MAG: PrsW family glutamic-type intramembrane protease [Candidatus Thermoplasmatota archaeon]|nr:PrsW family glutamic-type intramembrane protease [Candidatus Thermoplasmatota archaeon]